MTNVNASRDASVDEIIELLMLSASDLIPNAPKEAIHIYLKQGGNWETEAMRGTPISDYKPLKKKAARIRVILDSEIMAQVMERKAAKEEVARSEEEAFQAQAAERGKLDWKTLGYARLLEARDHDQENKKVGLAESKDSTMNGTQTDEKVTETKIAVTKTETTQTETKETETTQTKPVTEIKESETQTQTETRKAKMMTVMGPGVLLETRDDGVHVVELEWALANNANAVIYTRTAELTKEEQIKMAMEAIRKKQEEQKQMQKNCLKLLDMIPTQQLSFEVYNKDLHEPRVHMSDFPVDRKRRKVLSLTLRGKNFTDTLDIELHEDSILLHLYLAVEQLFGIPMIHLCTDSTRRIATPGILLRRSWAQFTAGLADDALQVHGISKLDMVGCPSSEWKEEEKLGSLVAPMNWFKKLTDCGVVDVSRSGMIIINDLRPPDQRKAYNMVLGQTGKGGMGFVTKGE